MLRSQGIAAKMHPQFLTALILKMHNFWGVMLYRCVIHSRIFEGKWTFRTAGSHSSNKTKSHNWRPDSLECNLLLNFILPVTILWILYWHISLESIFARNSSWIIIWCDPKIHISPLNQMFEKYSNYNFRKSKIPNKVFCYQNSTRVDLLLNHKICATSAFLRALNGDSKGATWKVSHFPNLLQIRVTFIETAVCFSPYFRTIPSLTAISAASAI